jgi:DNA-binding transcriptional MocR family regulator
MPIAGMNVRSQTAQPWHPDLGSTSGPKYLAIAEALARDIDAGVLRAGDRLPPQRALAEALGIDMTTVTRAYGEAQRRGLIAGDGRRGSFVRAPDGPAVRYSDPGDIGMNAPPEGFGGTLAAEFRKCVEGLLAPASGAFPLQYQPAGGIAEVRQAGADLLGRRDVPCDPDTVLIAAGGQNALHAVFSAELEAGDAIGVGQFAYPGLIALALRFGVTLRVIADDAEGMDPDALDAACAASPLRAIYLVPTNDNPTARTMSLARREALAQVAERHGLLVIEDDAYGLLPAQPLAPVAAFAPERTWHIASVSKVLAPGLRVAWLRAPDLARAWRLAADMHETAIMAPPLNAAIVGAWVRSGVFDRLVGEVRAEARRRGAVAREILAGLSFASHPDGYHLWVPLREHAAPAAIADALKQHGISAIPSEAFAVDRSAPHPPALRVSIGGTLTLERLRRGLSLLPALAGPGSTRRVSLV